MQSGAVWLWRERRGAALGRCRNGGAQPGGGAAAADEGRGSRPEGGWACGPEFAHCWGLPRNKGKIDYPRRKRI